LCESFSTYSISNRQLSSDYATATNVFTTGNITLYLVNTVFYNVVSQVAVV